MTAALETILSRRLRGLEARIAVSDATGIQARWEFGQALLAQRVGKQLPAGLLARVCADVGVSRSELQKRVRFAERYPTDVEVRNAVAQFGSWHRIVADALHDPPPRRHGVSAGAWTVLTRVTAGTRPSGVASARLWRAGTPQHSLSTSRRYLADYLAWLEDVGTLSAEELDTLGEEIERTAALLEQLREAHAKRCDSP